LQPFDGAGVVVCEILRQLNPSHRDFSQRISQIPTTLRNDSYLSSGHITELATHLEKHNLVWCSSGSLDHLSHPSWHIALLQGRLLWNSDSERVFAICLGLY